MPDPTVTVERLVIFVHGQSREQGPVPGMDILSVDLTVKNPLGSPGSDRRVPAMEVRDPEGRVYPAIPDDSLAVVIPPDESVSGTARFEVAEEAMDFELYLEPGTPDETSVTI